jgi:phage tail-like protein
MADPYSSFNFAVEIDGMLRMHFAEASGLDAQIDIVEHREGGDNITTRKLPGMVKFSNIVLKWGMTDEKELYDWHRQWATGDQNAKRLSGSIVLYDRQRTEKKRWNFINAWPCKWTGPAFNAESSELAIETLELAHEGVEAA